MNTYGGSDSGWQGKGTIFKIKNDGTGFHVIHSFNGGDNDGIGPHGSFFMKDSTLYATTLVGGKNDSGTVFKINVDGTGFQIMHSFTGGATGGSRPYGVTFVELNSTLYGTTLEGGNGYYGTVFKINLDGSGFGLLHTFTGGNNGQKPFGGLILSGTTLYGAASDESTGKSGVIYAIENDGSNFRILHRFNKSEGEDPISTLLLSDSTLYGVTFKGGSNDLGVVFSFDLKQPTGVHDEKSIDRIENFRLFQNYPNPFNPTTVISYRVPTFGNVKLVVYNLLGQKIKTLVDSYKSAGEHSVVWNATNDMDAPVPSGMYVYRLEIEELIIQKKMALIR